MSDPTNMSICFVEDDADFAASVASYERGLTEVPPGPLREVVLDLQFPFATRPGDILIASAFDEDTGDLTRFHDGPVPEGRPLTLLLPVADDPGAERTLLLQFEFIRPDARMTCGWTREEYLILPPGTAPTAWSVELLDAPDEDPAQGTSRLTRITALPR